MKQEKVEELVKVIQRIQSELTEKTFAVSLCKSDFLQSYKHFVQKTHEIIK